MPHHRGIPVRFAGRSTGVFLVALALTVSVLAQREDAADAATGTLRDLALEAKFSADSGERARALERLESLSRGDAPRAVLAELELCDALLRAARFEGVDARLERLERRYADVPSVSLRARALRGVLRARKSIFIEPNAVVRVDLGEGFRRTFLRSQTGANEFREIPLQIPLLFLSDLEHYDAEGERRVRPPMVVGITDIDDVLSAAGDTTTARPQVRHLRGALDLAARGRALVALVVFIEDAEPPALDLAVAPWRHVTLLWVRGNYRELDNVPRRSRYEWIPATFLFRLERNSTLVDWCGPWDAREPFERSLEGND